MIENIGDPVPDDVFQLVTRPEEAPDEPELLRIGFEAGGRRSRWTARSSGSSN